MDTDGRSKKLVVSGKKRRKELNRVAAAARWEKMQKITIDDDNQHDEGMRYVHVCIVYVLCEAAWVNIAY